MVFYWFGLFSPLEAEYRWHSGCCACSSLKGYWVREFKTFPLNMYHTPCDRKKHNFCSYNCRKPKSVKFRCQLCTRTKAPLTGSFSRFIVDWTSASCVLCWLHSSKPGWELQMRHTVLPLAGGGSRLSGATEVKWVSGQEDDSLLKAISQLDVSDALTLSVLYLLFPGCLL